MATDDSSAPNDDSDDPSLRQRVHSATGDRDAEAKALADRAGEDISEDDAKSAVKRAHGDTGVAEPTTESDLASPDDAKAVREDDPARQH